MWSWLFTCGAWGEGTPSSMLTISHFAALFPRLRSLFLFLRPLRFMRPPFSCTSFLPIRPRPGFFENQLKLGRLSQSLQCRLTLEDVHVVAETHGHAEELDGPGALSDMLARHTWSGQDPRVPRRQSQCTLDRKTSFLVAATAGEPGTHVTPTLRVGRVPFQAFAHELDGSIQRPWRLVLVTRRPAQHVAEIP